MLELHTDAKMGRELIIVTHDERISVRLTAEEERLLKDLKEILSEEKGLNLSQSDVVRYAIKQLGKQTR